MSAAAARRNPSRRLALLSALLVGVAASASAAADDPELVSVARVSARPPECGGGTRAAPTRWDRARVPGLDRYCDALARGYAALGTFPKVALDAASLADGILPGRAAPPILSARAHAASGESAEAWADFERAVALSPRGIESPQALHDFAVAALRTGHREAAIGAYRVLVPRVALLDNLGEGVHVLLEAGVLWMSLGPEHLPEAIGYLGEARRRAKPFGVDDEVLGALALAESRSGHDGEALSVAEEASGPWRLEGERPSAARRNAAEVPAHELTAVIALLAEGRDCELAVQKWEAFLAGEAGKNGPFALHARNHRDALRGGNGTKTKSGAR